MPIYKLALYAGITLISVGTLLFLFDSPRGILGNIELESDDNIEAFAVARNAATDYFDENGDLSYTFKSSKLSHYRPSELLEDSYTAVEAPNIVFLGDNEPWRMQSDHGLVDAKQMITLSDNVELRRSGENGEITTMKTSELIIDTENKVAYTEEAVTIVSPLGEITAVGMRADMYNKKITLLSRVKGRHQPQKIQQ